jgi:hypothetical protein
MQKSPSCARPLGRARQLSEVITQFNRQLPLRIGSLTTRRFRQELVIVPEKTASPANVPDRPIFDALFCQSSVVQTAALTNALLLTIGVQMAPKWNWSPRADIGKDGPLTAFHKGSHRLFMTASEYSGRCSPPPRLHSSFERLRLAIRQMHRPSVIGSFGAKFGFTVSGVLRHPNLGRRSRSE